MYAATTAQREPSMDSGAVGGLISDVGEWMDFLNSLESLLAAAEAQTSSGSAEPSLVSQAQELVRGKRKLLRRRLLEGSQSTTSAVVDSATESSFDLEPLEMGSTRSVFTTNIDVDVLGSFDTTQIIKANRDSSSSQGFVDAFRQIALQINPTLDSNSTSTLKPAKNTEALESSIPRPLSNNMIVLHEMRMHYFNRSYPIWRKLFTHSTQSRKLLRSRPKDLRRMTSAISPKMTYFALCSSSQYFIYRIATDFNDPPELIYNGPVKSASEDTHYFVSMNERWVAFASVEGHIFIVCLATGNIIYKDDSDFNIQALDVSLKGSFVVYTILSTDKTTLKKQPMICILCANVAGADDDAFSHIDTVTFTSPYSDMIKTIKVSPDETFLMCGTDEESRLFGVSLLDPRQPRILLRSSRKVSDDPEYEGITDIEFFDDSRSLLVTSVSQGCPPVIFDTKISNGQRRGSSSSHTTTNIPSVVMRIDKFGSKIHRALPSPVWRGAAFVDKSGAVYILASSRLATESRKFTVCLEVAASNTKFKAASIQWSPDGTVLVAVDRKGVFQAADFGAGLPGSSGMSKARALS
ncbi:SPS-sensor component PTR3 [Wickerhamiella sorbophila]|uniref:SPS-sensor component PTR3 n=1 Tax=Wickerhamiella sorbophila TaxID=45607 RepID=A0A2T0FCL0_9ASCO|nr:SPS-sensor component PTR3 [Wickerhamiella sorbophila]PRT52742.1 SPS-sensor component PTR3 [Wickerhamiella sorbophila]